MTSARNLLFCTVFVCLSTVRESRGDKEIERRLDILEKLLILETNSIQDKMSVLEEKMNTILAQTKEDVKASGQKTTDANVNHQSMKQAIDTMNRHVQRVVKGAQIEKKLNHRLRRDIEMFKNGIQGDLESILDEQKRLDYSIENITDQVQMVRNSIHVMESSSKVREISVRNITDKYNMIMKTVQTVLTGQERQNLSIETLRSKYEVIEEYVDLVESCSGHKKRGCTRNGIYIIQGKCTALEVYCDMEQDGGGWAVFQRRKDGSEDFYRTWNDYKRGFGELDGEFWSGNDNLNLLTLNSPKELRIDMEDWNGNVYFAKYSNFTIGSEAENYTSVFGFSGNVTMDSLRAHNGKQFSTRDRDNDANDSPPSCAEKFGAAWWYSSCYNSNLNGQYNETSSSKGIRWWGREDGKNVVRTLRKTEMKFRDGELKSMFSCFS